MAERIKYKIIPIVRDWGLFTHRCKDTMIARASTTNRDEAARKMGISTGTISCHLRRIFGIYEIKTHQRPSLKSWINQIKGDVIVEKSQSLIITHGGSKLQNRKI